MRKVLFLAAAVLGLVAATRPPNEFDLMTKLNGQPNRWLMQDGGQSAIVGTGLTCVSLAPVVCRPRDGGSDVNCNQQTSTTASAVIKLTADVPMNVCVRPQAVPLALTNGAVVVWDGGCNGNMVDPNFGDPIQPNQPYYVTVGPNATQICGVSDAGLMGTALFRMQ